MRRMGQGEREFTRRGEIHETRSKASNTARTGPTGGRRDRLSRFTRGDHARLASGGHRGQPSPSLAGKIWRAKAAPRGSGTGREVARAAATRGRAPGKKHTSRRVGLNRAGPPGTRGACAGLWRAQPQSLLRPCLDRETNRLMIDPRLRAIGIRCDHPPQPSQLKKNSQPASEVPTGSPRLV